MSIEFNSDDRAANSLPNPFKFENIALLCAALAFVASAISVLLMGKDLFQKHSDKVALVSVALAVGMLGVGIKFAVQALSQMRFYFSRKFPLGLASELPASTVGEGAGVKHLQEAMRTRSIEFTEPAGALNGILYSLVKNLITSPPAIQAAAVQHFNSVAGMGAILISLIISYFMFAGTPHEGIASWLYLPMTGLTLLTPFMQAKRGGLDTMVAGTEDVTSGRGQAVKLVGLVAFSTIAPVLIPRLFPAVQIPPMWIAPSLLLVGSVIASLLFLSSIFAQLDNASQTSVSCEQTTLAMNCPPAQLWTAIGRDFQDAWVRNIPNKGYANIPPDVHAGERGAFQGCVVEETYPEVTSTLRFDSIGELLQVPYARILVLLNAWGVLVSVGAAGAAVYFGARLETMQAMEVSRCVLIVLALGVVAVLSFRIGHLLWSRMHYKSRLVWIEVSGTYQTSDLSIGNQFQSQVVSSSKLTRVEDATLRVWVADIATVSFGKDGQRTIMAMAPSDGFARATADRLVGYALEQSSVATPTSTRDFDKAQSLSILDGALRERAGTLQGNSLSQLADAAKAGEQHDRQPARQRGTIKFYDPERGFGFLIDGTGLERYFHAREIGRQALPAGANVEFLASREARGPTAKEIRAITAL